MKIFLSWSGERSRQVAELFKEYLTVFIQETKPWVSTQDIQSGSFWASEINAELSKTSVGIVCLTADNKDKPWIMFEAGALVKGLSENRVTPYLIDIDPSDVGNPLSQLNLVQHGKDSLFKLIVDTNMLLGEKKVNEKTLQILFDKFWPDFEARFDEIIKKTKSDGVNEKRKQEDMIKEILSTVRRIDARDGVEIAELEEKPTMTMQEYARRLRKDGTIEKVNRKRLYEILTHTNFQDDDEQS